MLGLLQVSGRLLLLFLEGLTHSNDFHCDINELSDGCVAVVGKEAVVGKGVQARASVCRISTLKCDSTLNHEARTVHEDRWAQEPSMGLDQNQNCR